MTLTDARDLYLELQALAERHEDWRGRHTINLNAANNVLSPTARRMLSTRLADKGISGGLGRRHHMGGRFVDEIETIVARLASDLFGAAYAEYRPASGSIANAFAIAALTERDDAIMVLAEGAPGHQSYRDDGWGGRLVKSVVDLPFDYDALDVDLPALRKAVEATRPRLMIVGTQILLFPYNLAPVREIADEVGALLLYDGAHVMGLLAGGAFQTPLREGAHLITGSTQKSLPGPIGGLILTDSPDLGERIFDVSTRLVSNYENNRALALGVALAEMSAFGRPYAAACLANARAFARALAAEGFTLLAADRGYTASNQVILRVRGEPAAQRLAETWEAAGIIATAVHLPSPRPGHGRPADSIRIGVQEVTRLGMAERELARIARLMRRAADGEPPDEIARQSADLVRAFPTAYYTFEHPAPPR